ncbi:MAG: zinc-binding dehydrogenase [Polyangiales bacterium]
MTDAHLATSDPSCARRAIAWNVRCTGRGGLGQYGLELLRLLTGCAVIAVDTSETKRRVAKELGAAHALDGNDPQLASKILDLTGGSHVGLAGGTAHPRAPRGDLARRAAP